MKIYLDMDDVLADFTGGLAKLDIKNRSDFIHKPRSDWTTEDHALDKEVVAVMSTPNFFYNLSPCHGAFLLWDSVRHLDPWILTARPSNKTLEKAEHARRVTSEKYKWIVKHFGEDQGRQFICCLRSEKAQYAVDVEGAGTGTNPNILVDDLLANISMWEEAGGIPVWHSGRMDDTMKQLNLVLKGQGVPVGS